MRTALVGCAFLGVPLLVSAMAHGQPEMPGPYTVSTWVPTSADAPPVPLTPGGVFIPKAPGPFPPVALVHGAGENGGLHTVMATTLASRGLVVLAPSFPDLLASPTPADGDNVNALLDWAVTKSGDPSSPLAGLVDGSRRGVLGHSNGGVVFYAAAHSSLIKSIVSLDGVAFLDQSPGFAGPSLHLLSAHHDCNGGSSVGYMGAPPPKLLATVVNGDHCDVDNPADPLCPYVCGGTAWNATASGTFHRYAIAWTACILAHDTSVAPWVGGPQMQDDIDAGLLTGVDQVDVAMVSCAETDGGTVTDAGSSSGSDSGSGIDASTGRDGGADSTTGSGSSSGGSGSSSGGASGGSSGGGGGGSSSSGGTTDASDDAAGEGASSSKVGGCGCKTAGTSGTATLAWWAMGALVWLARRRRRS
jgi:MYXO-CTERM domain-containing protein